MSEGEKAPTRYCAGAFVVKDDIKPKCDGNGITPMGIFALPTNENSLEMKKGGALLPPFRIFRKTETQVFVFCFFGREGVRTLYSDGDIHRFDAACAYGDRKGYENEKFLSAFAVAGAVLVSLVFDGVRQKSAVVAVGETDKI